MKLKLLISCCFLSLRIFAQDNPTSLQQDEGTALPSEQTWKQIESTSRLPQLRQAPDEDGSAQKETPLPLDNPGYLNLAFALVTGICYAFYKLQKKNNHENY